MLRVGSSQNGIEYSAIAEALRCLQGVHNSSKPFQILQGELLLQQQLMTIARLVSLLLRVGCRENGIELRTIVAWWRNQKQTQGVDNGFQAFQI